MMCAHCGAMLQPNSGFCGACGRPVARPSSAIASRTESEAMFNVTPTGAGGPPHATATASTSRQRVEPSLIVAW